MIKSLWVVLSLLSFTLASELCFNSCRSLCGDGNVDYRCSSGKSLGINSVAECKCENGTKFTCDSRFCDQKCLNHTQFKCETASHPTCMCTTECKAERWCAMSCNGNYEYTCVNNQEMCNCTKAPLAQVCDRERCDKGCKGNVKSYTCDDNHENCQCASGSYSNCNKQGCSNRCNGRFEFSCGFGLESNCTCITTNSDAQASAKLVTDCHPQSCRSSCKDSSGECIHNVCQCGYGNSAGRYQTGPVAGLIGLLIVSLF